MKSPLRAILTLLWLASVATTCKIQGTKNSPTDSQLDTDTDSDTDSPTASDGDSDIDVDTGTDTVIDTDSAYEMDTDSTQKKRMALIVGISDYPGDSEDLSYCDDDATDWYYYLKNRGYEINILGDSNPENYPVYHDLATLETLRRYIRYIVTSADANDRVVLTFSGHGRPDGTGGAKYMAHDMLAYDEEDFVEDLSVNLDVGQIYISLDICNAGGFGPKLMAMDNSAIIHNHSTCSAFGLGYDSHSLQNGMWTGYLLEGTLLGEYSDSSISMETAFAHTLSIYPKGDVDTPEMYDGGSDPFYLSSVEISTSTFEPQFTEPVDNPAMQHIFGTAQVSVVRADWSQQSRSERIAAVDDSTTFASLLDAIDATQSLLDAAPRCLFSHYVDFPSTEDDRVVRVGACLAEAYSPHHPGVMVTLDGNGHLISRKGLKIADPNRFIRIIETQFAR